MSELVEAGISQREACRSIGTSRATWNRWRKKAASPPAAFHLVRSGVQPHALSAAERAEVLALCNSERFQNSAPRTIVATLLDEGRYLASASTFYRILEANDQVHERRAIATHPARVKPELLTTAPNELWSWDITKLPGPAKWTWFSLYLVLDVFSRFIVAWEVATRESAAIAKALFREAAHEQGVQPGQLHIRADGGPPMKAKSLALLFADLGISKSHSRPRVSNDNPFSEAHSKRSNTGRNSRSSSLRFKRRAPSCLNSCTGTTTSIVTAPLRFSRRPTCTSAGHKQFLHIATPCCKKYGSNILGVSARTVRRNAHYKASFTSTNQLTLHPTNCSARASSTQLRAIQTDHLTSYMRSNNISTSHSNHARCVVSYVLKPSVERRRDATDEKKKTPPTQRSHQCERHTVDQLAGYLDEERMITVEGMQRRVVV